MRKNIGFTLIELLVVISIIGILASVVLVRLNDARRTAQDAKRISEMRQLKIALETYYEVNNQYPPNPAGPIVGCSTTCIEGGWSGGEMTPYMNPLPVDPFYGNTLNGYRYAISGFGAGGNGRQSYTMLIRNLRNFTTFCSMGTPPGNPGWVATYPPCGI